MKLSQSQIDTIIEGLENPNTRLEVFWRNHDLYAKFVCKKNTENITGSYDVESNNKPYFRATKKGIIDWFEEKEKLSTFELITETRIKI